MQQALFVVFGDFSLVRKFRFISAKMGANIFITLCVCACVRIQTLIVKNGLKIYFLPFKSMVLKGVAKLIEQN